MDRSAELLTTVVAVAVFVPGPGSLLVVATVAVAFKLPVAFAATATITTTLRALPAPMAVGAAQLHNTVVLPAQVPPLLAVLETSVVPAGRGKLIDTAAALSGPLFVVVAV